MSVAVCLCIQVSIIIMADVAIANEQPTIFPLVAQVSDRLQINLEEAQRPLEMLRSIVPRTIDSLERAGRKLEETQRRSEEEIEVIRRDIESLKQALISLKSSIDSLYGNKAGLQSSLDSATSDLSRAESEKRRAEQKKDDAVDNTIISGAAAGILGVLFPPSLIVTGPAVVAGGTHAISKDNDEIDRCKDRISSIRGSIAEKERQISLANNDIANIQRRIKEYEQRRDQRHTELGTVKNKSVSMLQAKNFFNHLIVAVEAGKNPTELLYKLVETAIRREQYVILNNEGVRKVAQSFAAAWEEVETVINSDEKGFLNIDFVEVLHLH